MDNEITLYRPVGQKELDLIEKSGFTAFPPRLPEQPIFFPVVSEEYATQIARDWNAKYNDDKVGYVTRFNVQKSFLERFDRKTVGGSIHQEYWIPSEELDAFNKSIIGNFEVISIFRAQ